MALVGPMEEQLAVGLQACRCHGVEAAAAASTVAAAREILYLSFHCRYLGSPSLRGDMTDD